MSGFVGWWEVMSAEEAVIEQEIKQIRELCRDMFTKEGETSPYQQNIHNLIRRRWTCIRPGLPA